VVLAPVTWSWRSFENEDAADVVGPGEAPCLTSLAESGATFTDAHAITHPSQPNYLALFSGFTHGVEEAREPGHALPPGQRAPHRQLLRHVAEQPAHLHRASADVEAEDPDLALLHGQQGDQQPDGRRLARAVGAEQAEALAGGGAT
jgi:hypothetical protein